MKPASSTKRFANLALGFVFVGIINTLTGVLWLLFLGSLLGSNLQLISLTLGNVFGIVQGHFLLRRFVWRSHAKYFPELKVFIVSALPMLTGSYFFFFMGGSFGFNFILVQFTYSLVASIFAFIWNYRKTFRIVK